MSPEQSFTHANYLFSFQGGHFDLPDRMFYSVKDAWLSASQHNMADVRELIPEFFYLPDFLVNSNGFDLGVKQNGVEVDNVTLPPWAKSDPREFIRAHREVGCSGHFEMTPFEQYTTFASLFDIAVGSVLHYGMLTLHLMLLILFVTTENDSVRKHIVFRAIAGVGCGLSVCPLRGRSFESCLSRSLWQQTVIRHCASRYC